ncbi:MAG: hypothetical protein JWP36_944 [Paucimonas sp.]|jgi:peptidoglycan/xylan/chitin deacetylase (PgdA/CDA1 family)|nr:hypothetical protein [Paucimonas sp.]
MGSFVISLDFEMFWGVTESRTIANYRRNVEGEWLAIPRILKLFRRYQIRATWATVGMLMCRDYRQWREIRPRVYPAYANQRCSTYSYQDIASKYPRLFFARPLVEQILETPGQEVGTHTYSHFFCGEPGATTEQFIADLECAKAIGSELGIRYRSLVFPRNQVTEESIAVLGRAGIQVYRGNPSHWIYSRANNRLGGITGRTLRLLDSWLPLSGPCVAPASCVGDVVNVSASHFLRRWDQRFRVLESLRLERLKQAMTSSASSNGHYHLWWHPHNFGVNLEQNLHVLELVLQHYSCLHEQYGMQSVCMGDFSLEPGLFPQAAQISGFAHPSA